MRFHADALSSFWALMAIVMQNTAVLSGAEASLRTVRALRRPQRALQRPLRHAQSLPFPSLPFPVSLIGRKAKSATNSLLYNLQRLSVSRVLPGGTMAGSAIHAGSAPELPCRWPTTVVCSRMFMTRAAGGLVLAAPFSNRVFQEFLLLLHEAWATVFALSRVLWGSEQLFLRCKRTSIAHDVKIT
ncbi:MAG: hypothetical protein BHW61_06535 [Sutterella sp. 63_29]|nr:MAG: hypothetical protein BHW61_06535 [Sutterella sp. 63_29]